MLRIAVPNKGSLSEPASAMLHEAGYRQRKDRRELVLVDAENEVEFFFLRPRDIAVYVGSGKLDIGITGRDLLLDSGSDAEEIMQLGFAGSTFRYATLPGTAKDVSEFGGMTIASSFSGLVKQHLADNGVEASVVHLDGAVETAIQLGVAQVIADVVETGTTLRNAGLEIIGEPILKSEAVVIRREGAPADDPKVQQFLRRMQGVLVARRYVMMDYDIRVEHVEKAVALTPGLESPTVSPLHHEGWVAVRSMVPSKDAQRIMDELYALGARAILTTGIHACRL
ncbi:ATP phosphoribosyltransferase [Streptomyces purpurogeneiscleroticus]|uniref:ATP phosphoribosyltransferase n=1 Tax=Streptomyces purpurogeneiscleroticus TaxID=68259 RepID=UPI001CBC488D|nr:ATP phosphoribosyltransferase [Streptomyces purpurogeneiscleroticus]MBZ4018121.1 ATP phosphoribosyltransferase [Streptomyces purpurogeneiscleroticus]